MDDETAEILRRKTAFIEQRKRSLGPEYYQSKGFWDRMWEKEWESFEERENLPSEEQIEPVPIEHPTIKHEGDEFTIYTYSDFTMLHNQGIFRESSFVLDHTGKWKKNVMAELQSYGFVSKGTLKKNHEIMEASK